MNYLSPDRPRHCGFPMYVEPSTGKPIAAMPLLAFHPAGDSGKWEAQLMLANAPNRYSWHHFILELEEIPALFSEWLEDPEKVMVEKFGWQFKPGPSQRPVGPELSLEDLGL